MRAAVRTSIRMFVLVCVSIVLAVSVTSCGDSPNGGGSTTISQTDLENVRQVVRVYLQSQAQRNGPALCGVLTERAQAERVDGPAENCPEAVSSSPTGPPGAAESEMDILANELRGADDPSFPDGDTAHMTVAVYDFELVRNNDGWLIDGVTIDTDF